MLYICRDRMSNASGYRSTKCICICCDISFVRIFARAEKIPKETPSSAQYICWDTCSHKIAHKQRAFQCILPQNIIYIFHNCHASKKPKKKKKEEKKRIPICLVIFYWDGIHTTMQLIWTFLIYNVFICAKVISLETVRCLFVSQSCVRCAHMRCATLICQLYGKCDHQMFILHF